MIRTVDAYVAPGLALLADWSIRWGVLIGLLAAWWLVRPPRRASTRHLLGLAVMVAGLLLPALPRWGSGWTWPGPDAGPVARTPNVAPEGPVAVEPPWIAAPAVEVEAQVPRAEATIDRPVVRTPAPRPTAEPLGAWRVALLALGVAWAGGAAVAASRLVLGWCWLARLKRSASPAGEASAAEFEAYRAELGMRRRARLATHPDVGSPVTLGGLRPVVVVPTGWPSLPEPARRAGSLHELAHLARGDDWARLGQEAVRAVFWFHPAVHWLLNRIDRERELLCDEAAVTRGVPPRDLARMLLEFAKRPRVRGSAPQAMPFLSRGTVKARIGRLLEDDAMRWMGPLTRGRAIALGLVAIALALGAGSVRVSGAGEGPNPGDGGEAARGDDHRPAGDESHPPDVRAQDVGDSAASSPGRTPPAAAAQPQLDQDAEPREPVRVEIPLKIRVLDAETDRPIARFGVERRWVDLPEATRVMWFDAGPFPTPRMIESPDGSHDPKFVYYDDGRRRCDWLRVVADGYLPQTATAEPLTPMDADGEILATIRLHRGRTVTGRVLDRDGKPAAGARVLLLRRDGGTTTAGDIARYFAEYPEVPGVTAAVADAEGRFAIEGVGDDNALGVHSPPVPLWVAPVPAGASEMTIRLPATGAMRLRYDIEGGAPKATGFVQLVQPGAPEVEGWESLQMQFHPEIPNGDEVTLEGLSPGRYRVSRDFGPFALDASEVVVKPGETADVPFVRDSGHPVEGEVAGLDRLDKPQGVTGLDQVFVAVEAGPGPMSGVVDVVQADPGGRFRTTRIPPGTYLARAYGYTEAIMRRQAMFSGLATPGVIGETRVTVTADRPPPPVKIPLNEDAVRSGASAPPPGAGPAAELRPMADEPRAEHEVRVRGVVVDAETRRPITRFVEQGGMADAKDPSKVQWGFSETRRGENPEGTFSVTVGGPSRLRVRFLADGYRPEPVPVDPSEVGPGDIEVVVKMRRGEPVAGRVLDHEGRPVAGASVFLVSGLPLTISGGKAVLPFGPPGGEEPSATKTTTDAQGRFTLTGNGGDAALVAVSCPALDVWVVPVPEDGRELTIRLPRPGGLEIHYDLPGADPEGEIVIQLTEPRWERVSHVLRPKVRNGDTLVLDNLTPGTYDVARYKQVKAGDDPREGARGLFLDRRTLVIASGETARIEYFHKVSHRVSGRVVGLGETGAGGAIVTVENPDEDPTNRTPRKRMIHDAVGTGKDGAFTTASLFPGTYTFVAEVYPPEKDDGVFRTGWRLPAFVGTARVTVPALSGERAPDVTIEVRPYEPPRSEAPRQSADSPPRAAAPAARGAMEFTLVGPDGRPIPDAEVALCSLRGPVQIRRGKLSDPEAVRRTTGPEGRATFPRPGARGVLVAIHDRGISVEPILPDTAAIRAVLDPWGRVEGTLLWGTEPGAGEPIGLTSLRPLGPKPFAPDAPPEIEFYDEAATDAAGRFAFERVAPGGPVQLSRFVDGYLAAYDHVEVEPGSTARATIGGVGPPVVGRVELTPELAKVSGDLRKIKVGITLRPPSVSGPQDAVQEQYRLHRAFLDSDRGRLHLRKDIPLDDDGAFRVEGLPPQQYVIYVSVFGEITEHIRPFGSLARRFEVPSPDDAKGPEVVDLGVLRPASTKD